MSRTKPKPLAWSAEQLTRCANVLELRDSNGDTILGRISDAMAGGPKAARWDTGASSNKPWCWVHERELRECHRADLSCLADDIVGGSDSTGDQAVSALKDKASTDLHLIEKLGRSISADVEELMDVLERWPAPRQATLFERSQSLNNRTGCESCARVKDNDGRPLWGEPRINGSGNAYRTNLGGQLPGEMFLCQTCTTHVNVKGILPPKRELEGQVKNAKRGCRCEDKREVWTAEDGAA